MNTIDTAKEIMKLIGEYGDKRAEAESQRTVGLHEPKDRTTIEGRMFEAGKAEGRAECILEKIKQKVNLLASIGGPG